MATLQRTPLLGVVADDVTGATDIASALAAGGMSVLQVNGIDAIAAFHSGRALPDAIVVGLKIRSIEPDAAMSTSREAVTALQRLGIERFFWKYCSTFDSTADGNIGPVGEALQDALQVAHSVVSPAFIVNRRQVFQGNLFVDGVPLDESPLRHHPLNPMTDSDVRRLLDRQLRHSVAGHQALETIMAGPSALRAALDRDRENGARFSVVDAIADNDLETIAAAVAGDRLITGSAGVAAFLPTAYRREGWTASTSDQGKGPRIVGNTLILAGSVSGATRRQLKSLGATASILVVRPQEIDVRGPDEIKAQMLARLSEGRPVAVATASNPEEVAADQEALGTVHAAKLIEDTFGELACAAREAGVCRFLIAGGETSGAVVDALGADVFRIGPQITPGVPWTTTETEPRLAIACKSGNFGSDDFFIRAIEIADMTYGC